MKFSLLIKTICMIFYCALSLEHAFAAVGLGTPVKLSDETTSYQISPDGKYVIYLAKQNDSSGSDIYSIPIEGGSPVKLTNNLNTDDRFIDIEVTPDSKHVLYIVEINHGGSESFQLFSVPIKGGTPISLNGNSINISLGGSTISTDIFGLEISPDSKYVVYKAGRNFFDVGIYSEPVTGGNPVHLSSNLGDYVSVGKVVISKNSQRVVFSNFSSSSFPPIAIDNVFSVPIGGGVATRLNTNIGDGQYNDFKISDNSQYVVYSGREPDAPITRRLFSVAIEGSTPKQISSNSVSNSNVSEIVNFQISANSKFVVYYSDQDVDAVREIFSVPIEGGKVTKLNHSSAEFPGVVSYKVSYDSNRVVYVARQYSNNPLETLFSNSIEGGLPTILAPTSQNLQRVDQNFHISSNGQDVVFKTIPSVGIAGSHKLHQVSITGGTIRDLVTNLDMGISIDSADRQISSDGQLLIYRTYDNGSHTTFMVPIRGGRINQLTNSIQPPVYSGSVQVNSTSNYIVYMDDRDQNNKVELFSVEVMNTGYHAIPSIINLLLNDELQQ